MSITLALASCGGGDASLDNNGASQAGGMRGKTAELRAFAITPSNLLGIKAGTRLQFAATGVYSDNSVQDLTKLSVWTSSDTSVATISNAPDSKGQAIAVSRGYCSISATLDSISVSIAMGVK